MTVGSDVRWNSAGAQCDNDELWRDEHGGLAADEGERSDGDDRGERCC